MFSETVKYNKNKKYKLTKHSFIKFFSKESSADLKQEADRAIVLSRVIENFPHLQSVGQKSLVFDRINRLKPVFDIFESKKTRKNYSVLAWTYEVVGYIVAQLHGKKLLFADLSPNNIGIVKNKQVYKVYMYDAGKTPLYNYIVEYSSQNRYLDIASLVFTTFKKQNSVLLDPKELNVRLRLARKFLCSYKRASAKKGQSFNCLRFYVSLLVIWFNYMFRYPKKIKGLIYALLTGIIVLLNAPVLCISLFLCRAKVQKKKSK